MAFLIGDLVRRINPTTGEISSQIYEVAEISTSLNNEGRPVYRINGISRHDQYWLAAKYLLHYLKPNQPEPLDLTLLQSNPIFGLF